MVRIVVGLIVLLRDQKIIILDTPVLSMKIVKLCITNGADFFLELEEGFFDGGVKRERLNSFRSHRS